jgi:HPt (histidine-containing phosphotransfer) domain-containing protein
MTEDSSIDQAALERLRRLDRGGTLVRDMIALYLDYAPTLIAAALQGEQAGNLEAIERAAHSLKSSSANLGAHRIHDLAQRIELLAQQENLALVSPLVRELAAAFEPVKNHLEALKKELSQ